MNNSNCTLCNDLKVDRNQVPIKILDLIFTADVFYIPCKLLLI